MKSYYDLTYFYASDHEYSFAHTKEDRFCPSKTSHTWEYYDDNVWQKAGKGMILSCISEPAPKADYLMYGVIGGVASFIIVVILVAIACFVYRRQREGPTEVRMYSW